MMARKLVCLAAVFLTACSAPSATPDTQFQMTNFKVGDICFYPAEEQTSREESGWVCRDSFDVFITNNGTCTFDSTQRDCTWYGFSFDYENATPNQELTCRDTDSEPVTLGNPAGIVNEGSTIYEYKIPLNEGAGHYFNPQYSIFRTVDDPDKLRASETVCFANETEVFRFTRSFHYPGHPD